MALGHASPTHIVSVAVTSLDKSVATVRALIGFFLSMCLLVVDHVAQFRSLNVTLKATEELICAARCVIDHVVFLEAHVARIWTVPIAHALLDRLRAWLLHLFHCFLR